MTADGTNSSKCAGRGRFLDGIGEMVSLRLNGVGGSGGGLDKVNIPLAYSTVNAGQEYTHERFHFPRHTLLDCADSGSTWP